MEKGSIYHFSANLDSCACKLHAQELEAFASENAIDVEKVYIDSSLKKGEQVQYKKMLHDIKPEQTLIIRDVSHFNRWTNKAFSDIAILLERGVKIMSWQDGEIRITDGMEQYKEPLRCAFYHSNLTIADERLFYTQERIAKLFCKEKTNWYLTDSFHDETDEENLHRFIDHCKEYDLLIVGSFSRLDLVASRFMKKRKEINMDIYSLREGLFHKMKGV